MKKTILPVAVAAILFVGCKYEEGPTISLLTKKARMENTWNIDKAMNGGEDVTSEYEAYTLDLEKDGNAKLTAEYTAGPFAYTGNTNGTWEFENSKENVNFDYEDDAADQSYQILKLTSTELWLREIGGDLELHLK